MGKIENKENSGKKDLLITILIIGTKIYHYFNITDSDITQQ